MEISAHLRVVYSKIFNNESNYVKGSIRDFLQSRLVFQNLPKFSSRAAEKLDCHIIKEEVGIAVNKLKKSTSPGNDGATPELIQTIYEIVPDLIVEFVKDFLDGGG